MKWIPVILIFPYLFLLLKIYRSLLNIKAFTLSSDPSTFVSIVVACRNEEENLHILLNSITAQDYPKELFEVIIVNDNSTDRTFEIAAGFSGSGNIITVNNKSTGKKQALMTGINRSSGNLIITTDADCHMGQRWIKTIAEFYEKYKPDMIICPVKIESGSGFFKRFQELEFLSLQGITAGTSLSGEATMCNGANLSFTREAYENNSDNLIETIASGDDIFFLHSLKKQRHSKILWLESVEVMVTTAASPTVRTYLKQRRRWLSKGKAYNDLFTIILAFVTFGTIMLQLSLLVAGFFNPLFWWISLIILLLKSVPDYLILRNTLSRYSRRQLMSWFLPAQIVYPFYVLAVVLYTLIIHK